MRVITGTARGRRLKEPTGLETRPTTDRVKEGIFSSIQFEIEGRRVLDLFGGTGQMGDRGPLPGRGPLHLRRPAEGGGGNHPGKPGHHRFCRPGPGDPGGIIWPS